MLCQGGCDRTKLVQRTVATQARQTARTLQNDPILVCTLFESCSNGYLAFTTLRYADRWLMSQRDSPCCVNYKRRDKRKVIWLFGTKSSSLLMILLTKVGNHQKQNNGQHL
ncbi:hypothetical protein RvY_00771 [Ramazzottius varieornatus]|uniref:Uncharacterized protein n=1 Tax=Ramazzottius varieornatus TaxID=947166 RepID=A0A1D1UHY3_RAMVA|nr:hypothetical protein RvY_00771 [Ramazzottius varieornatus]